MDETMTFHHILLNPLEVKFCRPMLITRHGLTTPKRYYMEAHPSIDGHRRFWTDVKERYSKWETLAKKWQAFRISRAYCPEFPNMVSLIGWTYELFLGIQPAVDTLQLWLKVSPPIPMSWEQRLREWRKRRQP